MTEDNKKTHFGYREAKENEKHGLVKEVFDSVASKYDLMNDVMSLGTHRLWKKFIADRTGLNKGESLLDVAGGTADIALLCKDKVGETGQLTVFDINHEMLLRGRSKCIDRGVLKGMRFVCGDAESIPFPDNTFHAVTIGFGIRNVTNIPKALKEMTRVVKPGGKVLCLEFSHPVNKSFAKLYDLYSFSFIPAAGKLITGDRDSYRYLAESIRKFPAQDEFKTMMEEAGLAMVKYNNLFGGIAAVHEGVKF